MTRGFCGDCATPLWFRFDGDSWIGFTLGSLDEPDRVLPTCAFGAESKRAWFDGLHSLPHLTADTVLLAEQQAKLESFQHPDGEESLSPGSD